MNWLINDQMKKYEEIMSESEEITSAKLFDELERLANGVVKNQDFLASSHVTNTVLMGIWRTQIQILYYLEKAAVGKEPI